MNPLTQLHLDAAERNLTIARRMLTHFDAGVSPTHDDWVITIAFYSALHLVDAVFSEETGRTPENHRERNRAIRAHPSLSLLSAHYNLVRTASERVRYQPDKRVPPHAVQQVFDDLEIIRQVVSGTLEQPK